jgi:hypothetical protein
MARWWTIALLAVACDDDGLSAPPASPGTDGIGSPDSAGPMGVMEGGEADGDIGPDADGGEATTRADEAGADGATTASTEVGDGVIGGLGPTCETPGQTCEGDGECVIDIRTSVFTCSHGRAGEPCVEGSTCQDGLVCAIDVDGGQFVCAPL